MSETPSRRRRKGREAFIPGEDPMDHQPYKEGTWAHKMHLIDWLHGWDEAKRGYNAEAHDVSDEYDPDEDPCASCPHRTCQHGRRF